jgi:hypothetical protein
MPVERARATTGEKVPAEVGRDLRGFVGRGQLRGLGLGDLCDVDLDRVSDEIETVALARSRRCGERARIWRRGDSSR